jgi:hypothetical protein
MSNKEKDWSKEDQDWFNLLGGESVPDADPEVAKSANALRGALHVQQNQQRLPPLRFPKPVKQTYGYRVQFRPVYAIIILAILIIPVSITQYQGWLIGKPVGQPSVEKSPNNYFIKDVIASKTETLHFYQTLQAEGIQFTHKPENNTWIFKFPQQQALQYQKLTVLLARYGRKLPSPDSYDQAIVRFKYDEIP